MVSANKSPIADPVIILSTPRSYSSLACAMLGQHPELYDTLEMQLFEVDTLREWWAAYGEIHDSDGLTRTLAEVLLGNQTSMATKFAREWLWRRRTRTTAKVAWMIAEKLYPLALVEKTPIESASKAIIRARLRRRLRVFPRARFIHLVRNPLTYGLSHLEHLEKMALSAYPWRMDQRYRMMLDESTDPPTVDPQVLWLRVNSLIVDFLERVSADRKILVRGEDLVSEPESELRRITSSLGLRSDLAAIEEMKHPENSPFACLGPRNARFGGDPKFFRSPELRATPVEANRFSGAAPWRQDKAPFKKEVVALARHFGYAVSRKTTESTDLDVPKANSPLVAPAA